MAFSSIGSAPRREEPEPGGRPSPIVLEHQPDSGYADDSNAVRSPKQVFTRSLWADHYNTTVFQIRHLRSAGLKRLALSRVLEAQCFSWLGRAGISKDVNGVGCFCKSLPRFEGLRGLAIHFEYNGTFYHVNEPRRWNGNLFEGDVGGAICDVHVLGDWRVSLSA